MKINSKDINLLFFGSWPPPYGGISSHLYLLLPELIKEKYNSYLYTNIESGKDYQLIENGVPINYYCHKNAIKNNFFKIIFYSIKFIDLKNDLNWRDYFIQISHFVVLKNAILEHNIEVLFTYDSPRILVVPFLKKEFPNLKYFGTIYADFLLRRDVFSKMKDFLRLSYRSCDLILSCSQFCADIGEEFLGITYPRKVIYNNVDSKLYSPFNNRNIIRNRFAIDDDAIVLMTMCKMNNEMGINFLIHAHKKILEIDNNIILFFVGAKDELSDSVIEISKNNKKVLFQFDISFDEKHLFFAAADIFTAPTLGSHACMGIANIEAMMTGVPVLSSNSGGHKETILDGNDGYIVPLDGDSLDEVQYLLRLKKLVKDYDLRKNLGHNGRIRAVELFSNEKIARQHIDLIENHFLN
jgi:glycosyltransferase involved in cell wall biosynthesis